MPIIDSQVHVYAANTPGRPWATIPNWPDHVDGDEMVAAMDSGWRRWCDLRQFVFHVSL